MVSKYARQHRYHKALRIRWRAAGACVSCGTPCDTNPMTDRPYAHCVRHRIALAAQQRRTYQNRTRTKNRQPNKVNGKWVSLIRAHLPTPRSSRGSRG